MNDKEKYFKEELVQFQNHFEETENIYENPLERGGPREEFVRSFLLKHLPKKFGISSGKVISKEGELSKQIDIIIYDILNTPILFNEENHAKYQIIPADNVMAVIEVKSILTPDEFQKVIDNILSFKKLKGASDDSFGVFFSYSPIELKNQNEITKYTKKLMNLLNTNNVNSDLSLGCILPNKNHNIISSKMKTKPCFLFNKFTKIKHNELIPDNLIEQIKNKGIFIESEEGVILHMFFFYLLEYLNKWKSKENNYLEYFLNWKGNE